MKIWTVAGMLALLCFLVYKPHAKAEFVLDDYYTVARNPLIKNFSLYKNVWTSRLFDSHPDAGYIKFGYYRPILQTWLAMEYHVFGLKPLDYQWMNLLIHWLNCLLVYVLLFGLFNDARLALGASLLFCVLPTQEWVVRYITGQGDSLSALFGLSFLWCLLQGLRSRPKAWYAAAAGFFILAALTREVACSYILLGMLIWYVCFRDKNVARFCGQWLVIGLLPMIVVWPLVPKLGNILVWHFFYMASVGLCLWLARLRPIGVGLCLLVFAVISFYQGQFWTSEKTLLAHTHHLEFWPDTVAKQQILMRYQDNAPAIQAMVTRSSDPHLKAMWLRRLGLIELGHGRTAAAIDDFRKALAVYPRDLDTLNAYAVVCLETGHGQKGLDLLRRAVSVNPVYPDTLRTLGIYYYRHRDWPRARFFLRRSLVYAPDNTQAAQLLQLAKTNK